MYVREVYKPEDTAVEKHVDFEDPELYCTRLMQKKHESKKKSLRNYFTVVSYPQIIHQLHTLQRQLPNLKYIRILAQLIT